MNRIVDFALAHRLVVVLAWAVVAVAGLASLSRATGALSHSYALPGYAGYEANRSIEQAYGDGGAVQPIVLVVHARVPVTGSRPTGELRAALGRVSHALPSARIVSYASTANRAFVSADGRTTFALVYPPPSTAGDQSPAPGALDAVEHAVAGARVAGAPVGVTGAAALGQKNGQQKGTSVAAETMLGAVGAIVVLALVFGSLLALVPLLMALAAVPTTFLLVWAITAATDVTFIVQYFIALIGLGVAIDYALLVVFRWREERARGLENVDAVRAAMATAGRAVVLSGSTVAIGLAALVALPVPFLRSIGYAGLLIPLVSVAAASTLLPVVLASVGPALDRRRLDRRQTNAWLRWGALVVRVRWLALAAGIAVLAALLVPAFSLRLGSARVDALSRSGAAHDALAQLERSGIGAGALTPIEVLTTPDAASRLAASLRRVDGVRGAAAPVAWNRGGDAIVDVVPEADPATAAGKDTLARVRAAVAGRARVGGLAATLSDFSSAVYGSFPELIALIAVLTFLLLARALRSLVLPLKALALNVLSVGAAWGVLVLVWQRGHGAHALWGLHGTEAIDAWVPLIVFAFLYGISMDYEVFILTRIREEHERTGSTADAVARGLGRTGRLVTSAALILFLAFVAMASAPVTDTKLLATGFAAGILIDATVVRGLLVPALVALLGRRNWWLPYPLARALRLPHEQAPDRSLTT